MLVEESLKQNNQTFLAIPQREREREREREPIKVEGKEYQKRSSGRQRMQERDGLWRHKKF